MAFLLSNATHIQRHRGLLTQGDILFVRTFSSSLAVFTYNAVLTFSYNSRHAWSKIYQSYTLCFIESDQTWSQNSFEIPAVVCFKTDIKYGRISKRFPVHLPAHVYKACVSTCAMNILQYAALACVYKWAPVGISENICGCKYTLRTF